MTPLLTKTLAGAYIAVDAKVSNRGFPMCHMLLAHLHKQLPAAATCSSCLHRD